MKIDEVISNLEDFSKEQKELAEKSKKKNEATALAVSIPPWELLCDDARSEFEDLCDSKHQSELRKEKGLVKSLCKIKREQWSAFKDSNIVQMKVTDKNINAAFELYSKDEIIERLLADKIWFKLSDRQLHRDDIENQLSQHNEIMLEVIREAATIKAELYKMALIEVEEIIADYEVNHAS